MPNRKSQLFRFHDPVYYNIGNEYADLHPVFWVNGGHVGNAVNAVYGSNQWLAKYPNGSWDESRLADTVDQSKFADQWVEAMKPLAMAAKQRGDYVYLDLEHIPYRFGDSIDLRYAYLAAKTFRDTAPGLKLGFYCLPLGFDVITSNEEMIQFAKKPTLAPVKAGVEKLKPIIELLDSVDIPAYLQHQVTTERDLDYFVAERKVMEKFFPKTPFIYSAWGRYQYEQDAAGNRLPEGAAPETAIVPLAVLKRYASILTRWGDDVILFDLQSPRDDFFVDELRRKVAA